MTMNPRFAARALLPLFLAALYPLFACSPSRADDRDAAAGGKTMANLQAAYEDEVNAVIRYKAFAKQADTEGYTQVGSLFRAAARAERIHADNHARVIKKMGGKPTAAKHKPAVKSTRENLQASLKGENEESLTGYPAFIKQAKADKNEAAVRTFTYARDAEASHAQCFQLALNDLQSWKGGTKTFYVSRVTGMTMMYPVLGKAAKEYVQVK